MTDLIAEYYKHPVNNYVMEGPDASRHQGNSVCGDDITVYLRIRDGVVIEYSFDGNCSMITMAAASLLADMIEGITIDEVLTRGEGTMREWGFAVSPRRKRAAVIAILATHNAIYQRQGSPKRVAFEDFVTLDD